MRHIAILKSRAGLAGGLEKVATRIAGAFAQQGNRVSVLTTGTPVDLPSCHGIDYYPIKTRRWPPFVRFEQFDAYVQRWQSVEKADIVFGMDRNRKQTHIRLGNGVHAAFLENRILAEGRWKHLLCHLNPMHRTILAIEKEAFAYPGLRRVIANSHMVKGQIVQRFSIDPSMIEVIHNGVEWYEMAHDALTALDQRRTICTNWNLDPSQFHFLFIGNGYIRKGLNRLLIGLSRLTTKAWHLSVVGKENRISDYQAFAHQLGIQKNVRFWGIQRDTRPFYQLADALAIPSFYDPFANVTVEALAMGLFVVSSRWNGGHEVLSPTNGAIIENLLDDDAVTHALEIAMNHPKTTDRTASIRNSVMPLDYSNQLQKIVAACG
ncbi:MAG: hypothetical protein RL235_574 [Chlamydiota bacterium]|jgi:UDP-glucose:(heptosyl)LPS alpha-1,3-glucosyltransferase